jgi:hypothetical protein
MYLSRAHDTSFSGEKMSRRSQKFVISESLKPSAGLDKDLTLHIHIDDFCLAYFSSIWAHCVFRFSIPGLRKSYAIALFNCAFTSLIAHKSYA